MPDLNKKLAWSRSRIIDELKYVVAPWDTLNIPTHSIGNEGAKHNPQTHYFSLLGAFCHPYVVVCLQYVASPVMGHYE
jgi:hypothetical protein